MVEGLLGLIVWLLVIGLIFYVLWWAVGQVGVPEPFNKVIRVVLAVACAIILIYMLLGFLPAMPRLR